MFREMCLAVFAVLGVVTASNFGCSSCSQNGTAGDASTGDDSSMDTDSDSDMDSDTDSDSETDTDPWAWHDLPPSEDCGPGCQQLTFGEEVFMLNWDVWGDLLVYKDESRAVKVVNVSERKELRIPDVHPEYPIDGAAGPTATFSPAVFQEKVIYSQKIYTASPVRIEIVAADLTQNTQEVIYVREAEEEEDPKIADDLDVYASRVVTMGGCGNNDYYNLCLFNLPGPSDWQVVIEGDYGANNSIWQDTSVWNSLYPHNIQGYDFANEQLIPITEDEEVQMKPRIHGSRVVYQDLRFGNSESSGDWNHAAIFLYDLETQETQQITSGEWIACYPDINEDTIVWADYRECDNPNDGYDFSHVEIWGYNINTQEEFKITDLPDRPKTQPRIGGQRIFVDMQKPDGNGIYAFDLPEGAKK